jgi:hypothetical protein
MFDVWRLKIRRRKAAREFRAGRMKLRKEKKTTGDEYTRFCYEEYETLTGFDIEIDVLLSERLSQEALELDVEMPSYDDQKYWWKDEYTQVKHLTSDGRSHLRKLVDEEKTRRFEVTTRWIKLIALLAPVIGAAAGLVGAMIGWVAIHKK